jgi:hypothetical protein
MWYVMDLPCVGVSCMRVLIELGVGIELCGVLSCVVTQGVKWVKVVDHLFLDQYMLLLEDVYEQ